MQITGPGDEEPLVICTGCVLTDWEAPLQKIPGALADNKLNERLYCTPPLSTLWTVSQILHPDLSS